MEKIERERILKEESGKKKQEVRNKKQERREEAILSSFSYLLSFSFLFFSSLLFLLFLPSSFFFLLRRTSVFNADVRMRFVSLSFSISFFDSLNLSYHLFALACAPRHFVFSFLLDGGIGFVDFVRKDFVDGKFRPTASRKSLSDQTSKSKTQRPVLPLPPDRTEASTSFRPILPTRSLPSPPTGPARSLCCTLSPLKQSCFV